jgi:carbamoyl-phosphate synthase large subunit
MQVVYSDDELMEYLTEAVSLGADRPVLIDRYIEGKEVEVDAIADGEDILIPGVMEHIERTGVHSGDSSSVYPPHTIADEVSDVLIDYTRRITKALGVVGLLNIQYAYDGKEVFVIEVNPRASRTVPIMSKVTGVPMVRLAVGAMLGEKLADSEWGTGLYPNRPFTAVKMPVFSNAKLTDVDTAVGPEMKSTGEILAMDETYEKAVNKGFIATGLSIPTEGGVYVSLRSPERTDATAAVIRGYAAAGFRLCASPGTGTYLRERGMVCEDCTPADVKRAIDEDRLNIVINVPRQANIVDSDSFAIRRYATERGVPVLTCTDTAEAFLIAIGAKRAGKKAVYQTLAEYTSAV